MDSKQDNSFLAEENQPLVSDQSSRTFALDVKEGLLADKKFLPSKYIYDQYGDRIFQQIMEMPEYYLTGAEYNIFNEQKANILAALKEGVESFDLVEFGAGDGYKTKVLLQYFVDQQTQFKYVPNDISPNIVDYLENDLEESIPALHVEGVRGDFFEVFHRIENSTVHVRKAILFLGANIGNFSRKESVDFLRRIASFMDPDDRFMIGFDLKKNPATILNAYNDAAGITASFSKNLLKRINRELGGEFKENTFEFYPVYNPQDGNVKSYLISKEEQDVYIASLDQTFHFNAWEAMFMERSKKYSLADINALAEASGFEVVHNFIDANNLFSDSLWKLRQEKPD